MRAFVEHIDPPPAQSWKYQLRDEPHFRFAWHFHRELELTLVTAGRGVRHVGDSCESYEPGDLVLFGADLPHSYSAEPRSDGRTHTAITAQFRRGFLGADLFAAAEFAAIGGLLDRAERGLAFADGSGEVAGRLAGLRERSAPQRTVDLLAVLAELSELPARPLVSAGYRPRVDAAGRAMVDQACRFLTAEYARRITLDEVAAVVHLTPGALSRAFRRATGHSVLGYLINIRIAAACRLLIETELPVAEVATGCGYANLSNFNRQFLAAKGMPPRELRRAYRGA